MLDKTFIDFLAFQHNFFSPQMKRTSKLLSLESECAIYLASCRTNQDLGFPHGIFTAGGAYVPTQEKKKT